MHIGLRCPDVGSLIDEPAGQADRQIRRQFEMCKIELLFDLVGRILPGQRRHRSRCWASCFSSGGSSSSACARAASCASTSACAA